MHMEASILTEPYRCFFFLPFFLPLYLTLLIAPLLLLLHLIPHSFCPLLLSLHHMYITPLVFSNSLFPLIPFASLLTTTTR